MKAMPASISSHQWLVKIEGNSRHITPPLTCKNFREFSDLTLNFLCRISVTRINTSSNRRNNNSHMNWDFTRMSLSGQNTHYIAYNCFEQNFLDHTKYSYTLQDTCFPTYYHLDIFRQRKLSRYIHCHQSMYRLAGWYHCPGLEDPNGTWRQNGFMGRYRNVYLCFPRDLFF